MEAIRGLHVALCDYFKFHLLEGGGGSSSSSSPSPLPRSLIVERVMGFT